MKLLRHRADLKWLEAHLPHREVDAKGCVLCGVIKRQRNLIRMAEKQFDYLDESYDMKPLWIQEKRVLKDAGGK